mmetsp:Transcript_31700/g.95295  ORF Transcript_31700/g.95295 Transcript_31700/m.95295 type:complete len:372 (-) Transcript_31700:927-2042(-)
MCATAAASMSGQNDTSSSRSLRHRTATTATASDVTKFEPRTSSCSSAGACSASACMHESFTLRMAVRKSFRSPGHRSDSCGTQSSESTFRHHPRSRETNLGQCSASASTPVCVSVRARHRPSDCRLWHRFASATTSASQSAPATSRQWPRLTCSSARHPWTTACSASVVARVFCRLRRRRWGNVANSTTPPPVSLRQHCRSMSSSRGHRRAIVCTQSSDTNEHEARRSRRSLDPVMERKVQNPASVSSPSPPPHHDSPRARRLVHRASTPNRNASVTLGQYGCRSSERRPMNTWYDSAKRRRFTRDTRIKSAVPRSSSSAQMISSGRRSNGPLCLSGSPESDSRRRMPPVAVEFRAISSGSTISTAWRSCD